MPPTFQTLTRWTQRANAARQNLRDLRVAWDSPLRPPSSPGSGQSHPSRAGLRALQPERVFQVVAVHHPSPDAVTLTFAQPLTQPLRFNPGQFLTLNLNLDGQNLRRSYSLCSDPADPDTFAITARRVPGGLASNWLNDHAAPGLHLHATGPHGRFTLALAEQPGAHRLFIAGGAGITPILSMLRVLARDGFGAAGATLIYGSRSADLILFQPELDAIAQAHPSLTLRHVLDAPSPARPDALTGPLDPAGIAAALPKRLPPHTHAFICGPRPMMDAAVTTLTARGLTADRLHLERFASPGGARARNADAPRRPVRLTFARANLTLDADTHTTLLEASLQNPTPIPSSCQVGGCGACRVRLLAGDVEMEEPNCLTPEELAAGWRLACVSRPCGAVVIES